MWKFVTENGKLQLLTQRPPHTAVDPEPMAKLLSSDWSWRLNFRKVTKIH